MRRSLCLVGALILGLGGPFPASWANNESGTHDGPIPSGALPTDVDTRDSARIAPRRESPIQPRSHLEVEAMMMEYEESLRSFERTGLSMRDEIRNEIRRSVELRIKYIRKLYEKQIASAEKEQSRLRAEAITHFERFVKLYPDHLKHTPDALFRLAELYYEEAEFKYIATMDAFDGQMDLYNRGKIADEPETPEKDYSGVVRTLALLVKNFNEYRFVDAAYYLLGYTLIESGDEQEGREAYLTLVERFPKSPFSPECLLRLGELEFETANFEEAAKFYARVLEYPESGFYDLAIYKLAWSHYQMFDYPKSISTFKQLIAHYDQLKADGKIDSRAGELRVEAIVYVARSLADADWDGDGVKDPESGTERAFKYLSEGKPFEREILAAYAQALIEQQEAQTNIQAIDVYKRLIASNNVDPENPLYQAKIIELYDFLRDTDGQVTSRAAMAEMFRKGSTWYKANAENAKALARVGKLVEAAMRQRAEALHERAQDLKADGIRAEDPGKLAQSAESYLAAAQAYKDFLDRYPDSRDSYKIRYQRAEALYYAANYFQSSGDHPRAIRVYQLASDEYSFILETQGRMELKEDSGYTAIVAIESAIVSSVSIGQLPDKARTDAKNTVIAVRAPSAEAAGPSRVQPEPIPELVLKWIEISNRYIEAGLNRPNDPETAVKLKYRIAAMHYRFLNFEEARRLASEIIENNQQATVAANAADIIINTFKVENDWASLQKWLAVLEEKKLGRPEEQARLREQIRIYRLGAQFKSAEELLDQGKVLEAAQEFERLADQPGFKLSDKALYNAAVAYMEVKHYEKAARAFEKILNDPRFKESELQELALLQIGDNSKKFFDFEKAISSYLALYKRNRLNKDSPYALFEAAKLYENDGRFESAAQWFEEYESSYRARKDSTQALYRAALAWRSASDNARSERSRKSARKEEVRMVKRFIERARNQSLEENGALVLKSLVRLGELALERGREKEARRYFQETLTLFQQRSYKPGSIEATYGAQAQFLLLERNFSEFKGIVLKGTQKQMGRVIERIQTLRDELIAIYKIIWAFKANKWTYAALFRMGQIYQEYAQKFYDAPVPSWLAGEDLDFYQMTLQDEGAKWEDIAVASFEAMVKQARKEKITNEWLKRAIALLNQYKPSDYPLPKEERATFVWDDAWSAKMRGAKGQEKRDESGNPAKPVPQPAPTPTTRGTAP